MHSTRQLRPQYRQLLAVDLQKDRKTALLINGLAGRGFANALSFYLSRRREYLSSMEQLAVGETV